MQYYFMALYVYNLYLNVVWIYDCFFKYKIYKNGKTKKKIKSNKRQKIP